MLTGTENRICLLSGVASKHNLPVNEDRMLFVVLTNKHAKAMFLAKLTDELCSRHGGSGRGRSDLAGDRGLLHRSQPALHQHTFVSFIASF